MKINNFFQKGYYLNLDRREDRKILFEAEMQKHNLSHFFERVAAEDSIKEDIPYRKHYYCALTYYKLFQKIYEENYENVLIFEDDAFFYDDPNNLPGRILVENALNELANFPDWEMIYFGGHPIDSVKVVSKTLYKVKEVLALHAVGYKRSVIKKVLDLYTPFKDGAIDGWYGGRDDINKYLVYPIAIAQRDGISDLDASGKSVDIEIFKSSYNNVTKMYE